MTRARPGRPQRPAQPPPRPSDTPPPVPTPGSLRIVAGRWRGRRLLVPSAAGRALRPTGDRARETLFNVLGHRFQGRDGFSLVGARVLDVFAGTGALGLEALSRGASFAVFLERDPESLAALAANIAACEARRITRVLATDARRPPGPSPGEGAADLVFLDPPYDQPLAAPTIAGLATAGWLAPRALVCVETPAHGAAPAWPDGFSLMDERRAGKARLSILRRVPPGGQPPGSPTGSPTGSPPGAASEPPPVDSQPAGPT